jgi:hypothetical protein
VCVSRFLRGVFAAFSVMERALKRERGTDAVVDLTDDVCPDSSDAPAAGAVFEFNFVFMHPGSALAWTSLGCSCGRLE